MENKEVATVRKGGVSSQDDREHPEAINNTDREGCLVKFCRWFVGVFDISGTRFRTSDSEYSFLLNYDPEKISREERISQQSLRTPILPIIVYFSDWKKFSDDEIDDDNLL